MKIEYTVTSNDYLQYLLFTAMRSPDIRKKRKRTWLIVPVIYMLFAIGFYFLYGSLIDYFVIAFAGIALLWLAGYPFYQRWIYKRYYRKHVEKSFSHRVERVNHVELKDSHVYLADGVNESNLALSEFEEVYETAAYLFLMMKGNLGMIVPKREVSESDVELFKKEFCALTGLSVKPMLDWKWK